MRRLWLAILLLTPLSAMAQGVPDAAPGAVPAKDRAAIRDVIERQLGAFQHDDGPAAFAFASPGIKAMAGTPDAFMAMVRQQYQPVYRPREVQFQGLGPEEGRLTQRVLLVGPDNVPVIAHYFMERQPDGSWRISGCVLERSGELST